MAYSKIKSIEQINFMGYTDAKVIFDDSGAINLKGYNSSGKSAFLTGCAALMMNIMPAKQAKFIHHDTDYFRVIMAFDDGVTIVRDKYKNGQSLYEMYKDGKVIFTTKQGNKLSKVDDVPEVIKNYLGLIETELGFLNYQVYRDPLWLVDTKGSENYVSLNEALKSEEIARANALINSDRNKLNAEITSIESELQSARLQLDSFGTVGEDLLMLLYEREDFSREILEKSAKIRAITSALSELLEIGEIPEVNSINTNQTARLAKVQQLIKGYDETSPFEVSLEQMRFGRVLSLQSLSKSVKEFSEVDGHVFSENVEKIVSISRVKPLGAVQATAVDLIKVLKELQSVSGNLDAVEKEREDLLAQADLEGLKFVVCGNCGSLVEVEVK